MRMIDADKLILQLATSRNYHADTPREFSLLSRDIVMVDEQPTVDAPTVIRCKDCFYHNRWDNKPRLCDRFCRTTADDFFCRDGMSKGDS